MITTLLLSVILSIFSTAVMSYISLSTPMGPWIAPTLVLMGMALLRFVGSQTHMDTKIVYAVSAGSVGGILATACGFAFPTLYFLDASLFNEWMSHPLWFCCILGSLSIVSGWLGIWLANIFEYTLLIEHALPFPVGDMVYKVIVAQSKVATALDLFMGFWSSLIFCLLRTGIGIIPAIIPKAIPLLPAWQLGILSAPAITLTTMPMFWAIGFVVGIGMVTSLAFGGIARIFVLEPLHSLYFSGISSMEFVLAFCSGMVVAGVLHSFVKIPRMIARSTHKTSKEKEKKRWNGMQNLSYMRLIEAIGVFVVAVAFLKYFNFSLLSIIYLLFFAAVCAYQIALIAGKVGLAQLGRFATFVMVPAMFLFPLDYVQIVIIATFVQITGGLMTDILFGRKLAMLSKMPLAKVRRYQYFGLLVSACVVGIIFWLLVTHFQLGGSELFAQRAQSRALLIRAQHFNVYALLVGLLFGMMLHLTPFSPMLVLGGLLMPLNLTLGFMGGALLTLLSEDRQEKIPFWSGVFAANSLWMIIRAVYNYLF